MTDRPPASVSAVLILLLLNSLAWLAFAFIAAAGLHPSIPEGDQIRWAMSLLALLTSGTLIGLCVFMRRRSRFAYYLTLGLLGLLALLTVADEFGFSDLIVLIITVAPFALLIKDRAWYLQRNPALQNESEPPNTSLPAKGAHHPDVLREAGVCGTADARKGEDACLLSGKRESWGSPASLSGSARVRWTQEKASALQDENPDARAVHPFTISTPLWGWLLIVAALLAIDGSVVGLTAKSTAPSLPSLSCHKRLCRKSPIWRSLPRQC